MWLADSAIDALGAQLDKSGSWATRGRVASVFGLDPREDAARRKVRMLMSASTTSSQLDGADTPDPEFGRTPREVALMGYAGSLALMRGSEQTLRRYLADGNEVRRVLAAAALARQEHKDVLGYVRTASQSKDGLLRFIAVSSLEKVGTEQDLAWLQQRAQSDPYRRPAGQHLARDREREWRYPVREAATDAIESIEDRARNAAGE